jgi:hypothetical protein
MELNPAIMKAVERLDFRVTVGDVAAQAGLDIRVAEQGVLALASETGGHLQVAESGEIAYLFPQNFRRILQSKYFRLQLQEWWSKIWKILFYIIRISFGIQLIASIAIIMIAITILVIAMSASREGDGDSGDGGMVFMPGFGHGTNFFWIFYPDYNERAYERRRSNPEPSSMNFLEAVYSFLFGDGNPNTDLDERRWRTIATVIRNNRGAVVAEQIAPYLDNLGQGFEREYEEYMLPVLSRFNGRPEVSPEGQIIYHFPELQVSANDFRARSVPAYLKESLWKFSAASSGQIMLAIGLGVLNFVGALVLGSLLGDGAIAADIGGFIAFVNAIYGILLAYGTGYLTIPLFRYFWLKGRNRQIEERNQQRQAQAEFLNQGSPELQHKLTFAREFAGEQVLTEADLAYTTERELTEQELLQADKIDAEWRRRLESGY